MLNIVSNRGAARGRLRCGTALATGVALVAAGFATAAGAADDSTPERIIVTGSRIEQPDFSFSNPVVSVDADAVAFSGQTNLTTFLTDIPSLTGSLDAYDSSGSNAFVGGAGLNLLDLRNLGFDRTLVLVDGRRHVATLAESAAVDINTIPVDLIDRIDVLTGGASAIYGADGVTGVVNFVLKHDFEGVTFRAQAGAPNDNGADQRFISATVGQNFDEGRGNVTFALEHSFEERLDFKDRDFNGSEPGLLSRFVRNPAETSDPPIGNGPDDDPNLPDRIPLPLTGFGDTSRCGGIFTNFANFPSPDANCDGTPWDFGTLPRQIVGGFEDFPILPFYQQGGFATLQDDYFGFLLPENERLTFNAFLSYEFSPKLQFFGEYKAVDSNIYNESQPSFDFYLYIEPTNPYIPDALQQAADDNFGLFMSRDNFDLGVRGDAIDRVTQRSVLGFKGDLADWVSYEVSAVYGKSKITAEQTNNRFNDRFFYALDAVDNGGVIDCRSNVDPMLAPFQPYNDVPDALSFTPGDGSCVPLNLFGEGSPSPEAVDWIMNTTTAVDELEQTVVTGYFSGTLDPLFSLPGGSVGWAFGGEYREEKSASIPDANDTAGITFGNVILPNQGKFDVSEVFGEVNLPLLANLTLIDELSLDAAYRYSDYSTIGETGTWKVGGSWSPIPDITFRATTAEAVRAPNIGELFGAQNQRFEFITDPCDVGELSRGTSFRAGNCATILNGLGVDPGSFVDPNSASIGGVSGGNPDLSEETAETDTYGVVVRPRFIPGLTASVDYYDIELTDAVQLISPQEIAERCVDAPTLSNDFCPLIVRDPTDGRIDSFSLVPVNLAALTTSGYDFSVNYTLDPADLGAQGDWGLFNFRLVGNKLEDLTYLPSPGGVPDDDLGEGPSASFVTQPVPEWQATFDLTWERGPLTVNYGLAWFDETQRISNRNLYGDSDTPEGDPDIIPSEYYYFDAKVQHDVQVRFALTNEFSIYGGINNFTDEKPAFDQAFYPVSAVGRFFYIGGTAEFSSLADLVGVN